MIIKETLLQQMILNNEIKDEIIQQIIEKTTNKIVEECNKNDKLIILYNPQYPIGYFIAQKLIEKSYQLTLVTNKANTNKQIPVLSYQAWCQYPFGDILIDCLFLKPPLDKKHQILFDTIRQKELKVISLECNSGLDCDSGSWDKHALKSDLTLTLQALKPAFLMQKNHQLFQKVEIIDLNLTPTVCCFEEMDDKRCYSLLPKKKVDSYKTSLGQAFIVAGSTGMAGAAILAIKAALSTGLGYLHVGIDEHIYPIVACQCISPVYHINPDEACIQQINADAIGIGCGCNQLKQFDLIMLALLQKSQALILDGYALRWISKRLELLKNKTCNIILTPHLNEFCDLVQKPLEDIQFNLLNEAIAFVQQYSCILVLKGPNTFVVSKQRIYINQTGNAKLAKAGSGDVLCGLITGLAAQHLDCFEACMAAVYLHGKAAEISDKTEWGFLPEMIADEIEKLLKSWTSTAI